jgi:hypothetical protein
MLCPRHQSQEPSTSTPDAWVLRGNDRCCSYCGSWHPDKFLAFLSEAADPNNPGYIEPATKSYKIYIKHPQLEFLTSKHPDRSESIRVAVYWPKDDDYGISTKCSTFDDAITVCQADFARGYGVGDSEIHVIHKIGASKHIYKFIPDIGNKD